MKFPRVNPFARNLMILAAIALVIALLNQEVALFTVYALLRFAFVIALLVVGYLVWRDFGRREIGLWPQRAQAVFYSALALFLVDMGCWFMGSPSGREALALMLVAAASVYAGFRTWRDQQRLS